jgi:membrane protein implicated in regulation of membrane protease activity
MTNTTPPHSTFGDMLEELATVGAGLAVVLLPVLLLAVPGIVLFVALPAILLLALAVPLVLIGALIAAPPYLVARRLRRRGRRTPKPTTAGQVSSPRRAQALCFD